jgi:haloalkane dehalogenase
VEVLRTPDEYFENLEDYPFEPNFAEVPTNPEEAFGVKLRIHYVDEGPRDGQPVVLLHGEPSWSYLYRKMIPLLAGAGYRTVAPDLVGFGKSDKLANRSDYTYRRHVSWMQAFLDALELDDITLFCQDWGGLIGLRLVAYRPERFSRVVAANTFLPTGNVRSEAFMAWRKFSQESQDFPVGQIVARGCVKPLSQEVIRAYDAPFPDDAFKAGARQFPLLVPISPEDPEAEENRRCWEALRQYDRPFLTTFSDSDPITRGAERVFQHVIPGARNRNHPTIEGAGHFLQEDKGEELAQILVDFIESTGGTAR